MTNPTILTAEQCEHYRKNGFLVLENAIPLDAIEQLKSAALSIVDNFDINQHRTTFTTTDRDSGRDDYFFNSAENIHCFLEEDALGSEGELLKPPRLAINKIGHAMHDLDPAFNDFCSMPIFGQLLRDIGCEQPQLWQTMYIFKQPKIGGEVRWHQDASYLISEPSSTIGVWVAIEDAHKGNGCLWVQPGGQKTPLREIYQVDWDKREGTLAHLRDLPWPSEQEAIAVEVPAGSIVLFDDHMPHYSSQNLSENSRHAFTMHVASANSTWSESNWLQRGQLGPFSL